MSESKFFNNIDKIQNKSRDLYEKIKIIIQDFESSDKVRDEVKLFAHKHGCYCITVDDCLHEKMHKYIEANADCETDYLLDKVKNAFCVNVAAPVIGEYYIKNKKMDLSNEELKFLVYMAFGMILFIISGIAEVLCNDAANFKERE